MLNQSTQIAEYLDDIGTLLYSVPRPPIQDAIDAILTAYRFGRTIYVVGNGGSASTATHFACDLQKWTIATDKPRLKAVALTDNIALLTAWANDNGYEHVFEAQLKTLLNPGDVVVAISGSGNSSNVINAVKYALSRGAITVGLTGYSGGQLVALVDHCVVVPSTRMNQIEDIHMTLCHLIADVIRNVLAPPATESNWPIQPQIITSMQPVESR